MDIFAKRLKEIRMEKGLNRSQLAKGLSVSEVTISRWERLLRIPNIVDLKKIAEFFNVSADYLIGLQDF